jgi:hypothetical protein
MGRLDKTFKAPKAKLNEEFEPASPVAFKQPMGGEVGGNDFGAEKTEQTPEEKLEALTAKVDELYALLHGESEEAESEEGEEDGEEETDDMENLQEWNFDKKKGEKKGKGEDDTEEHEESETPAEEKAEHKKGGYEFGKKEKGEVEEGSKPKVPVNMIAKVGK